MQIVVKCYIKLLETFKEWLTIKSETKRTCRVSEASFSDELEGEPGHERPALAGGLGRHGEEPTRVPSHTVEQREYPGGVGVRE